MSFIWWGMVYTLSDVLDTHIFVSMHAPLAVKPRSLHGCRRPAMAAGIGMGRVLSQVETHKPLIEKTYYAYHSHSRSSCIYPNVTLLAHCQ